MTFQDEEKINIKSNTFFFPRYNNRTKYQRAMLTTMVLSKVSLYKKWSDMTIRQCIYCFCLICLTVLQNVRCKFEQKRKDPCLKFLSLNLGSVYRPIMNIKILIESLFLKDWNAIKILFHKSSFVM